MKRIALALCALSAMAVAAPPATEFKGHALGSPAPLDRLSEEWLLKCKDLFSGKKDCTGYASIAEAPGDLTVTIGADGVLEQVNVFFPADRFALVKQALISKYGPPTRSWQRPVQTKSGAVFSGELNSWRRSDGSRILATLRSSDVETSLVTFTSAAAAAEIDRAGEARERSRKADL